MSDQRNEYGAGLVQGTPRPSWWLDVTIKLTNEAVLYDQKRGRSVQYIAVRIILPNGTSRTFKSFPEDTPLTEIRREAGERFKEIWDPINRCER